MMTIHHRDLWLQSKNWFDWDVLCTQYHRKLVPWIRWEVSDFSCSMHRFYSLFTMIFV